MRDHYDFSKMKGRKNPYIKYLKQPVTMRTSRQTMVLPGIDLRRARPSRAAMARLGPGSFASLLRRRFGVNRNLAGGRGRV